MAGVSLAVSGTSVLCAAVGAFYYQRLGYVDLGEKPSMHLEVSLLNGDAKEMHYLRVDPEGKIRLIQDYFFKKGLGSVEVRKDKNSGGLDEKVKFCDAGFERQFVKTAWLAVHKVYAWAAPVKASRAYSELKPYDPQAEFVRSIANGNLGAVDFWLSQGASLQYRDENQNTPLHVAVIMHQTEIAQFLITRGADPQESNGDGISAVKLAEGMWVSQSANELSSSSDGFDFRYHTDALDVVSKVIEQASEKDIVGREKVRLGQLASGANSAVSDIVQQILPFIAYPWEMKEEYWLYWYQSRNDKRQLQGKLKRRWERLREHSTKKNVSEIMNSLVRIKNSCLSDQKEPRTLIRGKEVGFQFLNRDAAESLLEEGNKSFGLHQVFEIGGLHWKLNPEAPGIEQSYEFFAKLMTGQGAPPTALLSVIFPESVQMYREDSSTVGKPKSFLASKTIPGETLQRVLEEDPEALNNVLPDNFSAIACLGMLVNPTDGKAENVMVEDAGKGWVKLVPIDNDFNFGNSFYRNSQGKHKVNIQYVPFLLSQMNGPVDEKFAQHFCNQIPAIIMIRWLLGNIELNKGYNDLVEEGILDEPQYQELKFPIQFMPNQVSEIYSRLRLMRELIRGNPKITLWELFESVCPYASQVYRKVKKQCPDNILGQYNLIHSGSVALEDLLVTVPQEIKQHAHEKFSEQKLRTESPLKALQEFVNSIRWLSFNRSQQQAIMNALVDCTDLGELKFDSCSVLDVRYLEQIANRFSLIETLTITNCPNVEIGGISAFIRRNPYVMLTIGKCSSIKAADYLVISRHCHRFNIVLCNDEKISVDRKQPFALHKAIKAKDTQAFLFLLAYGLDVNAKDKDGNTALHHLLLDDGPVDQRYLSLLLLCGAKMDLPNRAGDKPISLIRKKNDASLSWVYAPATISSKATDYRDEWPDMKDFDRRKRLYLNAAS